MSCFHLRESLVQKQVISGYFQNTTLEMALMNQFHKKRNENKINNSITLRENDMSSINSAAILVSQLLSLMLMLMLLPVKIDISGTLKSMLIAITHFCGALACKYKKKRS